MVLVVLLKQVLPLSIRRKEWMSSSWLSPVLSCSLSLLVMKQKTAFDTLISGEKKQPDTASCHSKQLETS